jgi:hypothetical protein
MVLLQRPHSSPKALYAGLHGAAAIAMVGGVQRLHEGVAAGIMRFLRHQQQVALHMAALTKIGQHHAGLASGHAGLNMGSRLTMAALANETVSLAGLGKAMSRDALSNGS